MRHTRHVSKSNTLDPNLHLSFVTTKAETAELQSNTL